MQYLDVSIYVVRKFTVQHGKTIFLEWNSISDSAPTLHSAKNLTKFILGLLCPLQ